ncbi:MAG: GAF domain-containing protein [Anaerolineae bacterium]|nr:GAF domain-containing protein [Anaerolineae bacterium]
MSVKVLIVDDTPDTIQMLTVWLQGDGYDPVIVTNAHDALAKAKTEKPALILIDTHLPNKDGIITARELRHDPETVDIPIVLLTSNNPVVARTQVIMTGAVDYITKPINLRKLSQRVQAVLEPSNQLAVDTTRFLDEAVYAALDMAPCDLAWLLALDAGNYVLESRSIASRGGGSSIQKLNDHMGIDVQTFQMPVIADGNPIAAVARTRCGVTNLAAEQLADQPGTQLFFQGIHALNIQYIHAIPLQVGQRMVGVLVLGYVERQELDPGVWRVVTALSGQTAMALDYNQVAGHLADQEEMMKAEHAFLTTVLDTMGDALIVIGEFGEIEYVNNRLLRMTGYAREEVTGQRVELLVHPDDRQAFVYGLLHERGSTMKFDQRLYTKSGEVIPVLLSRSSFARIDPEAGQQVLVLSDLTVQKSREEALERYSQQLQALNQAAEAISSSLSPQDVIQEILHSAVNTVNAQGASVLLRSMENANELVFAATVGPEADRIKGMSVPLDRGVAGWVVREAKSQLVEDTSLDERFYVDIDHTSGLTTRSIIAVPLIVTDQVIGVLEVVNKQVGVFDHVDVDLLESVAGTAAVAIENARLFEQTRRRLNDLGTLLDASAAVSSTLDFGSVLELIARRLLDALRVERCQITAWDRGTNMLESLAEVADAYWPVDQGPVTQLIDRPVRDRVLNAVRYDVVALDDPACDAAERENLVVIGQKAVLFLPLVIRRKVVGLIQVYNGLHAAGFSATDIEHVQRILRSWVLHLEKHPSLVWYDYKPLSDLSNLLQAVPGVMWVTVEMWQPESNSLQRLRETGFALWIDQGGIQHNLDNYPTIKRVLSIAQPRVVERTALENDPLEQLFLTEAGGEVCLMAPLLIRGQPEGLVKLIDSDHGRRFDAEQISLCQGIANVVGNAMENANLYQSLERRAAALESAYAELKRADLLKEDLLQNLSHEIQTPLLHVLGYIELMYNEAFGPLNTEQREKLAFVLERAQHLSELAKNIITMQGLQTEQLDIRLTALDEVLPRAVSAWEQVAARRGITIKVIAPKTFPRVMADPNQLCTAIEHLLNNAIKFSPSGKSVELSVQVREAVLEICVRDQGMGIPREYHEHIFKRFYQVDSGASRKFGGAGLGLAIVQEIVSLHGGRVWVESEPGEGSAFLFTIPRATAVSLNDYYTPTNMKVE